MLSQSSKVLRFPCDPPMTVVPFDYDDMHFPRQLSHFGLRKVAGHKTGTHTGERS
jgi:hypothetical protein